MISNQDREQEVPRMNSIETAIALAVKQRDVAAIKDIIEQAAEHPASKVSASLELAALRIVGTGFLTETLGDLSSLATQAPGVNDRGSVAEYGRYENVVQTYLTNYLRHRDSVFGVSLQPEDRRSKLLTALKEHIDGAADSRDQAVDPVDVVGKRTKISSPDPVYTAIIQVTEQVKEVLWEIVHEGREAAIDMQQGADDTMSVTANYRSSVDEQFELARRLVTRAVEYIGGDEV